MTEYRIMPTDIAAMLTIAAKTASYGDIIDVGGRKYQFVYASAAKTLGDIVQLSVAGNTSGYNPAASVPATTAVPARHGVAAMTTTGAGGLFVQIGPGKCDAMSVNTTTNIGVGDMIQGVNGQSYGVQDGGATKTADSIAVAQAARISDDTGTIAVYLLDRDATIG